MSNTSAVYGSNSKGPSTDPSARRKEGWLSTIGDHQRRHAEFCQYGMTGFMQERCLQDQKSIAAYTFNQCSCVRTQEWRYAVEPRCRNNKPNSRIYHRLHPLDKMRHRPALRYRSPAADGRETTLVTVGRNVWLCVSWSFMKIGWGVSELWGGLKSLSLPLTWPIAYTTDYTTAQAVIQLASAIVACKCVCICTYLTGTGVRLTTASIGPLMGRSGWTMFSALVRRVILECVHTATGAFTTVNIAKMSLFRVTKQAVC